MPIPLNDLPGNTNFTEEVVNGKVLNPADAYRGFNSSSVPHWEDLQTDYNFAAVNASVIVAGTTWYVPFLVTKDTTLTDWAMRVNSGGSAGSVFVFGIIRARVGSYPNLGNVVYNSPPLPCSAVADITQTFTTPLVLTKGLYYYAVQTNSTSNVTFQGIPNNATKYCWHFRNINSTEKITRLSVTQPYSATFNNNQAGAATIDGAGYTPFLVKVKIQKTIPF